MRTRRIVVWSVAVTVLIGVACLLGRESLVFLYVRSLSPEKKIQYMTGGWENAFQKRLRVGMTQAEVESVVGRPQNPDARVVWIWWDESPPKATTRQWRSVVLANSGRYLVFWKGRLVSGLEKYGVTDPYDILAKILGTKSRKSIDDALESEERSEDQAEN